MWLRTLYPSQADLIALTIGWIDEHVARREAAIKADKRTRHLVRDGAHRWWVDGEWTAIREQGRWMHEAEANEVLRVLSGIYRGCECKAVRVLTPAPAYREPKMKGGSK